MTKLLLLLIFTFSISPVYAEWKLMTELSDSNTYIETNSVRHRGKVVSYWILYDFSSLQINGVSSQKVKWEDNCDTEEHRILSIVRYSEKMGGGHVLPNTQQIDIWEHIVPGTVGDFYHKFVCKKR